ncbi:prolyl-tRNA synthetase [Mycoplasmopsis canis UFG4]|uniref:Proline--tRNA ligase n=1 Tax=Mycoplasmopsis canis UFG4 TaxID=1131455 RepID=I1A4Q7_9BACT|nr:proline--tRNA ligase [Mycoplasmopsis canis]AKF41325.1 proline--tRNA ligase [Mycoplasmopsis canis]EIE39387.1 prolyl-tRNA synthetase [Mycoplasmopsis canis UF33]EIE39692.1 prolyl-tRNA synthetase [Mycoplasmopsis canis UF31]EIE41478.1 prolyl-tRNA synthetase [Mycoplasmopsis canis UFG4]WQQ12161.1 proline--tRNA ligase [Mycoplasmopsis canis]
MTNKKELDKITPMEVDFAKWYTDVVKNGNLIAYGPTKGSLIFKPNSYGIWEMIQKELNSIFKSKGIQNVYMPLLIPESLFALEKEHIAGFNPELATVTHVGNKELSEKLYIRPTSEVLFADLFKKSINSYNDLPMIYNQWANVLRWEKTTNPFLRSREFLWQEGHTSHSDPTEARRFTREMINTYAKFLKNFLAIPTIVGRKTPREKFAGACSTYTIEAMMKDGKALQSGTSHYLAQNFSKPYEIKFKNKENKEDFVYQTSWGVTTRLIGALIMTHGDNRGIIIPPRIAPTQVDILELFANKDEKVSKVAKKLFIDLGRKFRVNLDSSEKNPGFKASNSEIQGVPLRIEIGPRDLQENKVTIVRRDTLEKELVDLKDVKDRVGILLEDIHNNLYESAKERLKNRTVSVNDYDDFKKEIEKSNFVVAPFCCSDEAEERIKEETGATARCIPIKDLFKPENQESCIIPECKNGTKRYVVFAKAY